MRQKGGKKGVPEIETVMNTVENQVKSKGWGNILKGGVQVPADS